MLVVERWLEMDRNAIWQIGVMILGWFAVNSGFHLRAADDPRTDAVEVTINQLELPSSRQAQAVLQSEARFLWDQTPLRSGLTELANLYNLSIWIDRQIDPGQLVTTPAIDQASSNLHSRLRQIGNAIGAEVGLIENVVYFGPSGRISALQRAAVELHDQLSRTGDRSAQLRPWSWDELSSSTELLVKLEQQWKIKIVGTLPHDLYHAGQFKQPSTLATQLTVLVGGFELQAELQGSNQIKLSTLQRDSQWQARYRKEDLELRGLIRLKGEYPGSECVTRGSVSQVRGVTDFHLALLAPRPANPASGQASSTARWGFEVRNTPVEAVLNKLAAALAFEFKWDAACTPAMREQLISFKVDQATTDQLLAEISRVSKLKLVRDKQTVHIRP